MSVCENTFIGPYLRVWPPKETFDMGIQCCPKTDCPMYGKYTDNHFCAYCGSPVITTAVPKTHLIDMYDYCTGKFRDGDLFQRITETEDENMIIMLPNRIGTQGGSSLEYEKMETPFQDFMQCFDLPDWKKLLAAFDADKIKYEKCQGILQWCN